jgi:hypothetical protein
MPNNINHHAKALHRVLCDLHRDLVNPTEVGAELGEELGDAYRGQEDFAVSAIALLSGILADASQVVSFKLRDAAEREDQRADGDDVHAKNEVALLKAAELMRKVSAQIDDATDLAGEAEDVAREAR